MSESSYIFEATAENFEQGVLENSYKAPVLVDFWAEWCEPCKQLIPILEKLVAELQGQFVLAKVNSETQQALSQKYGVRNIPTVLIFKNGEIVEQFSGLQAEKTIRDLIEKHFQTEADKLRQQAFATIQAGDFAAGKAQLLAAEKLAPENKSIQIDLAHLEANEKQYDAAIERLNQFKQANREHPQVVGLINKINLARLTENAPPIEELKKTLETSPKDSQARYQLAIQLINEDEYESGMDHLLILLQRDPKFQDEAAQKGLISTFSLLGDEDPLVTVYRRKMFNAMH